MEKELADLKAELARKDKIIAGLQQRLFGSSSEKLDPAQLQLMLDELLLGKPAPPPDTTRRSAAPPACRELIRRARSRPIADEMHRFILGHLKTHRRRAPRRSRRLTSSTPR